MRYPALEVGQAGNPKCPDAYNQEATLICPGGRRLVVQVRKNDIQLQLGIMEQGVGVGEGAVTWLSPEPYVAGASLSMLVKFDAVRVRNWGAGKEAEVFVSVA